jgi:DUF1680 family protein
MIVVRGWAAGYGAAARGPVAASQNSASAHTLDLREPMALAARAIVRRLDASQDYRPWFLLKGRNGIPTMPEHASWDLGDMTGRYLEGLILSRHMGISTPELSLAESRLGAYLLKLLGEDGLVHDPASGNADHSFSQGSALYGLVAWFEDSGDPAVRRATERLISGLLRRSLRRGDQLVDITVKLPEASGSHLAGYQIFPVIRFYELTGYPDALTLAEGLTRWVLADPVIGADGAITKPLSWEGHVHSWLDTLAGCLRTARNSTQLSRTEVLARCRAVYDWVQRTNATDFGWIATYPTGGSSETCAISSAIRLALELAAGGHPEYLDDVERFVRNQVVEAQFRDLGAYLGAPDPPTPLLLGCFDSQSMPNCHLGTRGGEDVGNVEGCCLNGGMRALALAWGAIQTFNESELTINFGLSMNGPAAEVIGYQPFEGRVDVIPRSPGTLRVRLPRWAGPDSVKVSVAGKPRQWNFENGYAVVAGLPPKTRVSIQYPLREREEDVVVGGQRFQVRWKGDVVVDVSPSRGREPTYCNRLKPVPANSNSQGLFPDTYELQDAARLATLSMLARLDLQRGGQPFFRLYPFANPPRAEHEKWDDGDTSGRYVEGLILARRMTGIPLDPRERTLRDYLAGLFEAKDGLCYTRGADWTPRRACLFSQSSAMLGLLAWYRETGSATARKLLDQQVHGLEQIASNHNNYVCFPKYEYDGQQFVDDPKGTEAPPWYGGRLILPLVEYWQLSGSDQAKPFLEKLVRYVTEVSTFIKPDGAVEQGEGWWGHLHSTMDMAAGIAEFGRLTGRRELVDWAKRVYDWIGRTQTTRYGFVADVAGGKICESCAIASRIRLGLALYRAGAADPFGEIDRYLRNQLLENQFVDLRFLHLPATQTPRTDRANYAGLDGMIRGTFQCWGTANDLIGHDDIEGCGAGGGVQGLALAWNAQAEWRDIPEGKELRLHLLFNRRIRAPAEPPLSSGTRVAAELWSYLPRTGKVRLIAHQPIARLALRLPDGVEARGARVQRTYPEKIIGHETSVKMEGKYALIPAVRAGEQIELSFPLKEYTTVELANKIRYHARWKGSWVLALRPQGTTAPLYSTRPSQAAEPAALCAPRYP